MVPGGSSRMELQFTSRVCPVITGVVTTHWTRRATKYKPSHFLWGTRWVNWRCRDWTSRNSIGSAFFAFQQQVFGETSKLNWRMGMNGFRPRGVVISTCMLKIRINVNYENCTGTWYDFFFSYYQLLSLESYKLISTSWLSARECYTISGSEPRTTDVEDVGWFPSHGRCHHWFLYSSEDPPWSPMTTGWWDPPGLRKAAIFVFHCFNMFWWYKSAKVFPFLISSGTMKAATERPAAGPGSRRAKLQHAAVEKGLIYSLLNIPMYSLL